MQKNSGMKSAGVKRWRLPVEIPPPKIYREKVDVENKTPSSNPEGGAHMLISLESLQQNAALGQPALSQRGAGQKRLAACHWLPSTGA